MLTVEGLGHLTGFQVPELHLAIICTSASHAGFPVYVDPVWPVSGNCKFLDAPSHLQIPQLHRVIFGSAERKASIKIHIHGIASLLVWKLPDCLAIPQVVVVQVAIHGGRQRQILGPACLHASNHGFVSVKSQHWLGSGKVHDIEMAGIASNHHLLHFEGRVQGSKAVAHLATHNPRKKKLVDWLVILPVVEAHPRIQPCRD
mmetsp:Transcript_53512/g.116893  ORF Transcript_53512/g.116893 Transcript_53512/m.116893 type:complete len:202 (+) Transcript_53512:308-913(+)